MNKKIVFIYLAIVIIINVIGLFVLPNDIVMQVNASGEANWSLNKYLAIPLLLVFGVIGGFVALKRDDNIQKSYLLMVIIIVIHVLVFVFNL